MESLLFPDFVFRVRYEQIALNQDRTFPCVIKQLIHYYNQSSDGYLNKKRLHNIKAAINTIRGNAFA